MFALESFVLAWFLRISKHNVWVSQSILLQLLAMRTQNPNLSCASAFVRQIQTFHSIKSILFLSHANIFTLTKPFRSDLDPNRVCKCRERERQRERGRRQSKLCISGSTSREVCVCVCVCVCGCVFFLNFVSLLFLLWELVYVFQSFVSIFAKKI